MKKNNKIVASLSFGEEEVERLIKWPRMGIWVEKVLAKAGRVEDDAKIFREEGGYSASYTIEEQIQRVSDRIRASIRAFEYCNKVKIEMSLSLKIF